MKPQQNSLKTSSIIVSIISPVYKAEDILKELVSRLDAVMLKIDVTYEIILVDDRSPDNSWQIISDLCNKNSRIKGIRLSKNSGQQKAIFAGMQAAKGDFLVMIDCDLQENTEYIQELYKTAKKGFDIVLTKRKNRKFSWIRNGTTRVFYLALKFLTKSKLSFYNTGMLSIINRKVALAALSINSKNWFYLPVLSQLGFEQTSIEVLHSDRFSGKSSYSFKKLYRYAINLILGYSNRLLHLSIGLGMLFVLGAGIWISYLIITYFMGSPPSGYTSTMVAILLCTGIILLSVGILGLYIGKIFDQAKNNPDFFIDESLNF